MAKLIKSGRKKIPPLFFVATCGAGLEELVAAEIRECGGANIVTNPGAVSWEGKLAAGYRLCLWSRFASRVLLQIAQFDAPDTDTLYRQAGKIDWHEHFTRKTTFAVFSTITDSPITHSKFAALRVKDAIADQFRSRSGKRPDVDTSQPGMRINLHLRGSQATLAVDLSGDSLHRRGYRLSGVEAPLKETLAAGIVHLAGFNDGFPSDGVLLDPMCGSGTLLIEAAMIYGHTAPGLQRETFGSASWKLHDARLWEKLVNEATEREDSQLQKPWPQMIGYDADPKAVSAARKNIKAAGLEDRIQVSQRQLAALKRPAAKGMVLVNPPYGERLSEKEAVKYLYRCIGRKFSQELYGWQIGFFSSNPDLAGSVNQQWTESFPLFNGSIKCRLHRGIISPAADTTPALPELHDPEAGTEGEDFGNRLISNCRALSPWAQEEGIQCFRIYDRDLPEYNIAVDLYHDWVHVTEYASAKTVAPQEKEHRFNLGLQLIRKVLSIPPSRLFFSKLNRKASQSKPGKQKTREKIFEVAEQQCSFLVNPAHHPDRDLPLNLRSIRKRIGGLAQGRTFLNLFGGTGTATVHAMFGGAQATTTVEPSTPLAQKALANFSLNGFGGPLHETVEDSCIDWLGRNRTRYGLILINPPTPGSGTHRKAAFHAQDDHEKLLRLAMHHLAREGQLFFVTDRADFELAETLQTQFVLRDISAEMCSADFMNSSHTLRCWEFRHQPQETD